MIRFPLPGRAMLAAALAVAIGSAVAAHQPTPDPAKSVESEERIAANFFAALESAARAGTELDIPETTARNFRAAVGSVSPAVMKRGPARPDWNRHGTSASDILAAAPGGLAANVLVSDGEFGPEYIFYGDDLPANLLPEGALTVFYRAQPAPGERRKHVIANLGNKVVLHSIEAVRQVGQASCGRTVSYAVYSRTDVKPQSDDIVAYVTARYSYDELRGLEVCEIFSPRPQGGYVSHVFDDDGRQMTALDDDGSVYEVKPLAAIARR